MIFRILLIALFELSTCNGHEMERVPFSTVNIPDGHILVPPSDFSLDGFDQDVAWVLVFPKKWENAPKFINSIISNKFYTNDSRKTISIVPIEFSEKIRVGDLENIEYKIYTEVNGTLTVYENDSGMITKYYFDANGDSVIYHTKLEISDDKIIENCGYSFYFDKFMIEFEGICKDVGNYYLYKKEIGILLNL